MKKETPSIKHLPNGSTVTVKRKLPGGKLSVIHRWFTGFQILVVTQQQFNEMGKK